MPVRTATLALGLVVSILAAPALAQQPPTASPEHKVFALEEGTWDATIKAFTAGPDADPAVSKGMEVNTLMPGGMWVLSKFEGEMGGIKFEGRGQFGYDPLKKKYIGTWIDSMSPMLTVLDGSYDS